MTPVANHNRLSVDIKHRKSYPLSKHSSFLVPSYDFRVPTSQAKLIRSNPNRNLKMDSSHHPDLPDSERGEDLSTLSKSVDKSEAMFTMYLERSDEDDTKTTERWKRESDAILIFTGLFSAALASLIGISIQDLRPNSQDTSAFYLRNIYHLFANTTSPGSIVITIPTDPPKFSPPKYAILVNSLWFLSLAMSLTGALLAVFIQQWAHSYLQATQGRHCSHDRARIRTFYAEGIDKLHLPRITRTVPVLIHIALFLFFSGLPIFVFNVDRTVFNVVITWMGLCVAGYACVTLMPMFRRDSPYYSPLSSSSWWCVTTTLFIINQLLKTFTSPNSAISRWYNAQFSASHLRLPSLRGMRKVAEAFALKLSSDIDYRALKWMFGTLNEDDEFEQFFDALPGLCASETLEDPVEKFVKPNEKVLSHALIGMMDRTLLSDVIPEPVKLRRIAVCTKAINATSLLKPWWILRRVLLGDWHGFSRSLQFGLFVQDWKNMSHDVTAFYAQYIVSVAISSVQERDDRWFQLTSGQLNMSKSLVQTYLAYGDSVLLANVVFIVRRAIKTYSGSGDFHRSEILDALSRTLGSLCKFDILHTLPEQQHEFCSLWNQLVEAARNDGQPHMKRLFMMILKSIRRLYITLHEGTGASPTGFSITTDDENPDLNKATWYPICCLADHRPFAPILALQSDESSSHAAGTRGHTTARSDATIPAISPPVLSVLRSSPYVPYPSGVTRVHPVPAYSTDPIPFPLSFATDPGPRPYFSTDPRLFPPSFATDPGPRPSYSLHRHRHPYHSHPRPRSPSRYPPPTRHPSPIPIPTSGSPSRHSSPRPRSPTLVPHSQPISQMHPPARHSSTSVIVPESASPTPQGEPVIPPGTTISMPSPASAPSPSSDSPRGLGMPMGTLVPPPDQTMWIFPSPSLWNLPIPPQILNSTEYSECTWLQCDSPHSILYQGDLYPTALHLFEARMFLGHRPDLADRIRQCESIRQIRAISSELAVFVRRDRSNAELAATMDEVQYLKFRQHSALRSLLFNTHPSELVYMESRDPFWGVGAGTGMNEFGKSLMRARERLRAEAGM